MTRFHSSLRSTEAGESARQPLSGNTYTRLQARSEGHGSVVDTPAEKRQRGSRSRNSSRSAGARRRSGSMRKSIGTASSIGRSLSQSSQLHHEASAVIERGSEAGIW